MKLLLTLIVTVALQMTAAGQQRAVAITIDDLPRGGDSRTERNLAAVKAMTAKLMTPFREQRIPVIGFVNEGRPVEFGAEGFTLRYFRHPFLFTGPTAEIKTGMQSFLDRAGYIVAPVTLDNADYMFASLYTRPEYRERVRRAYVPYMESVVASFEAASVALAGREFPQVLLIHANELNADSMPELLAMFGRRGYEFVTLERALADEIYRSPDDYVGRNGFSWIHRWTRTKELATTPEPEPPDWVTAAYSAE